MQLLFYTNWTHRDSRLACECNFIHEIVNNQAFTFVLQLRSNILRQWLEEEEEEKEEEQVNERQ